MNSSITENYLAQAETGRVQEFRNLAMIPLVSQYRDGLDYLLLDEALEQHTLEVTEVDESGTVPELRVRNHSSGMVLILDGEELVGAKQNRIVNTTMLLAPASETIIPVSCVEAGRWAKRSDIFMSEKRLSPSFMRRNKSEQVMRSFRHNRSFEADQCMIWEDISKRQERRGVASPTREMAELYRRDRPLLDEYLTHFRAVENQVGAVFMVNGKIAGMECFGNTDCLHTLFSKLLESYAIDAVDMFTHRETPAADLKRVQAFLKECRTAQEEHRPSVALGTDCRIISHRVIGSALLHKNRLLHLTVFSRQDIDEHGTRHGRLRRMSERRDRLVE